MHHRNAVVPPPPGPEAGPPEAGPSFGDEPDTDIDLPPVSAPRGEMYTAPEFSDEVPTDPTPVPPPPDPAAPASELASEREPPRTILSPPPEALPHGGVEAEPDTVEEPLPPPR